MGRKKKTRKAKAKKQSPKTPRPQSSPKVKAFPKKALCSTAGLVILCLIIAAIIDQIPIHRDFSIETTAKEFSFLAHHETQKTPMQLTAHPFLRTLTASAEKLHLSTKEFLITETNEPKLKGLARPQVLKVQSDTSSYYHVENLEDLLIPTILSIYAGSDEAKVTIKFEEKDDEPEKLVTLAIPPGKGNLDMSTKQVLLRINDAKLEYGSKTIEPRANEIRITGSPIKIDIDTESSQQAEIKLHLKEGTICPLQLDKNTIRLITKLEFLKVSEDTKIYLGPKEKIVIKDCFIQYPDIKITGNATEIRTLETTDRGVKAVVKGEYTEIESVDKNTLLDEALRILDRFWKYIKELL